MTRLAKIERAVRLLGEARNLLKEAECPQATAYVRRCMKSAEGARRHALRLEHEGQAPDSYSRNDLKVLRLAGGGV